MPDVPRLESRFYAAIAMIVLPVVTIAVTSVALGGRPPGSTGSFGGIPPLLVGELVCLGPVFLGGIVLALRTAMKDVGRRD